MVCSLLSGWVATIGEMSWRRAPALLLVATLVSVLLASQPWHVAVDEDAGLTQALASERSDVVVAEGEADVVPDVVEDEAVHVDGELPDPAVLLVDGSYVAVGTNITVDGQVLNTPLRSSTDLVTWTDPVDAMPVLPSWAEEGQTWAPSIVVRDGHVELWFAALDRATGRQCIGVATSVSVLGPFVSDSDEPVVCVDTLGGAIDPEVVVVDGTTYLLWKNDGNCCRRAVHIWAQELDGTELVGDKVALIEADASWEDGVVENPEVVVVDGTLVLLYSGGLWGSSGYGTGYAVCVDLHTRCDKRTRSGPALPDLDGSWGSGGASAFTAADGSTWLAWHAWTSGGTGRSMFLAPLGSG